jgi:ligand-binding sensor domain-containing protein
MGDSPSQPATYSFVNVAAIIAQIFDFGNCKRDSAHELPRLEHRRGGIVLATVSYSHTVKNPNAVSAMTFDHDGNLWVASSGGIVEWVPNGGTYTSHLVDGGPRGDDVRSIAVTPDGALWFGTATGVSRCVPSQPHTETPGAPLDISAVFTPQIIQAGSKYQFTFVVTNTAGVPIKVDHV